MSRTVRFTRALKQAQAGPSRPKQAAARQRMTRSAQCGALGAGRPVGGRRGGSATAARQQPWSLETGSVRGGRSGNLLRAGVLAGWVQGQEAKALVAAVAPVPHLRFAWIKGRA